MTTLEEGEVVVTPNSQNESTATVEEDKLMVTPDANHEPISTDSQPTNGLENSEAEPANPLVGSEPTLDTKSTPEGPPSNPVVNTEARPDNVVVNSEAQTNNVVVSETQCSDESVVPETQCYNEGMDVSEIPCNNEEVGVSETHHSTTEKGVSQKQGSNGGGVVSETLLTDTVVASETQLSDEMIVCESQLSNEIVAYETQLSDEMIVCESQLSNEMVASETQHNKKVNISEAQPSNEIAMSDTQPNNETVMHESHIINDVVVSGTKLGNGIVMHEAQIDSNVVASEARPENELDNSTTDPNNHLSHPQNFLVNHQFNNLHMVHEDQLPQPESLPNSDSLLSTEPMADSHNADVEPIPNNHLPDYDILPDSHLDHSEAVANYQLDDSERFSHDQQINSQMVTHHEVENAETLHNNQLISSQPHYEIVHADTFPSYEIVSAENPPDNEEHTPDSQPNKRRKKKSMVWEHFTIETVSPECRRACCKQCKQSFAYSTGSKVAGTSHLKRHIAKGTCTSLLHGLDLNHHFSNTPHSRGSGASNTPKRRYRSSGTPYMIFDQDHCRHEIATMIIMHDYPLHIVEHPGFVAFVQNLQPHFNMVTFNAVQGDCVANYLVEKNNLTKYFSGGLPGRVCLTLDVWTSSQSLGYVFITAHFVDSDWKLQRRILNVVMEPFPDSDSALSHALAVCLSDWCIKDRLFTVTCNKPPTEVVLENLRPLLSVKNPLIFGRQLIIGNCIARTLSDVANDLLSSAQGIVNKIRENVKYVKTSESHEEKFLELKQQLQVPSERSLFIDEQTKWDTTYQMLVSASELKEVFSCLDTYDPDYTGAPSVQDWRLVETLCTYLKPLFDAANILVTTTHPTAVTFFHEFWKLKLDLARTVVNDDSFISNLTKPMKEKIDRYWRDCSLALAITVVMDPRFKMKLVEFSFTKIYGEDAHVYVKIVEDGIHELFHEYATLPPLTPADVEEGNAESNMEMDREVSPGGTLLSNNGLADFDVYIKETSTQHTKSEMDQYLEESLLPRIPDFDVLGWWKLNKLKYPTLSRMARDILAIPISTVSPDAVFDKKGKEMDQYRCSLRPETVEALICTKDWIQYGSDESLNALVKMEF